MGNTVREPDMVCPVSLSGPQIILKSRAQNVIVLGSRQKECKSANDSSINDENQSNGVSNPASKFRKHCLYVLLGLILTQINKTNLLYYYLWPTTSLTFIQPATVQRLLKLIQRKNFHNLFYSTLNYSVTNVSFYALQ